MDKFKVIETLGEGAQASIYLVENKSTHKLFVAKEFNNITDGKIELRSVEFLKQHCKKYFVCYDSHIIAYDQYGNQIMTILYEYIPDVKSLYDIITKKLLNTNDKYKIIKKLCEGVQKLHELGVCHKDLKAENVLVTRDKQIRIIDFGFACKPDVAMLLSHNTCFGECTGTPTYFSPQIASMCIGENDYDITLNFCQKNDIWALGILCCEIITEGFSVEYIFFDPLLKTRMEKDDSFYIRNLADLSQFNIEMYTKNYNIFNEYSEVIRNLLQVNPSKRNIKAALDELDNMVNFDIDEITHGFYL